MCWYAICCADRCADTSRGCTVMLVRRLLSMAHFRRSYGDFNNNHACRLTTPTGSSLFPPRLRPAPALAGTARNGGHLCLPGLARRGQHVPSPCLVEHHAWLLAGSSTVMTVHVCRATIPEGSTAHPSGAPVRTGDCGPSVRWRPPLATQAVASAPQRGGPSPPLATRSPSRDASRSKPSLLLCGESLISSDCLIASRIAPLMVQVLLWMYVPPILDTLFWLLRFWYCCRYLFSVWEVLSIFSLLGGVRADGAVNMGASLLQICDGSASPRGNVSFLSGRSMPQR